MMKSDCTSTELLGMEEQELEIWVLDRLAFYTACNPFLERASKRKEAFLNA